MKEFSNEAFLKAQEEETQKHLKEIVDFCKTHNITSSEMSSAYEISLGSQNSDENINTREEVFQLAKIIDDKSKEGLPLNNITSLIKGKLEYENYPEKFEIFLGISDFTEKEKKLLRGIVNKEKEGLLEIKTESGDVLAEFSITQYTKNKKFSSSDLAFEMMNLLKEAKKVANEEKLQIILTN